MLRSNWVQKVSHPDKSDGEPQFQFSHQAGASAQCQSQHAGKGHPSSNEEVSDDELGSVAAAAGKRRRHPTLAIVTHEAEVVKSKKCRLAKAQRVALSQEYPRARK